MKKHFVYFSESELKAFLTDQLRSWEQVGGGPDYSAFHVSSSVQAEQLSPTSSYFFRPDAWRAGVAIQDIVAFCKKNNIVVQYFYSPDPLHMTFDIE